LDPRNDKAVEIYRLAREEIRIPTLVGAPLLRTLTPVGVAAVMSMYEFESDEDRRNTLIKVMNIGEIETQIMRSRENASMMAQTPKR
jgi:Ca2+/Na+ antiporter